MSNARILAGQFGEILDQDDVSVNADFAVDDVKLTTRAAIKALHDVAAGTGQTWQNVSGSRSANVDYLNDTGKAIYVSVGIPNNAGRFFQVSADGVNFVNVLYPPNYGNCVRVPAGHYYRMTGGVYSWAELR